MVDVLERSRVEEEVDFVLRMSREMHAAIAAGDAIKAIECLEAMRGMYLMSDARVVHDAVDRILGERNRGDMLIDAITQAVENDDAVAVRKVVGIVAFWVLGETLGGREQERAYWLNMLTVMAKPGRRPTATGAVVASAARRELKQLRKVGAA